MVSFYPPRIGKCSGVTRGDEWESLPLLPDAIFLRSFGIKKVSGFLILEETKKEAPQVSNLAPRPQPR